MTPPVSPYMNIITPRSRRFRTIVVILLAVIILMSIFGFYRVMPAVHRSVGRSDTLELRRMADAQPGQDLTMQQIAHAKRTLKARTVVIYMAMAYWGVCSLLMVAVLFLAWLDFRETTRSFALQARALRQETVATLQQAALKRKTDEDEEDD